MLTVRTMPERDSIFHRYTAYLARRAGGMVLRWTIVCGFAGLLLGAITLTGWAHWPVSHNEAYLVALLGAISGAFLGRAIGSSRAQLVLFHAQLAQHQLEFERKLLTLGAAVAHQQQQTPQAQPLPAVETPAAVEAPVAPPAPVAPADLPAAVAPPAPVVETPVVDAPPEPEPEPAPEPEPEPAAASVPVYLPEPPLAFALPELPDLPRLPEPEPAFVAEPVEPAPVAFAPEPQLEPRPEVEAPAAFEPEPATVVPFAPRPESPLPAASVLPASPFASVGVPPLSDHAPAPAPAAPEAPAESAVENDPDGYGWSRPGVSGQ